MGDGCLCISLMSSMTLISVVDYLLILKTKLEYSPKALQLGKESEQIFTHITLAFLIQTMKLQI